MNYGMGMGMGYGMGMGHGMDYGMDFGMPNPYSRPFSNYGQRDFGPYREGYHGEQDLAGSYWPGAQYGSVASQTSRASYRGRSTPPRFMGPESMGMGPYGQMGMGQMGPYGQMGMGQMGMGQMGMGQMGMGQMGMGMSPMGMGPMPFRAVPGAPLSAGMGKSHQEAMDTEGAFAKQHSDKSWKNRIHQATPSYTQTHEHRMREEMLAHGMPQERLMPGQANGYRQGSLRSTIASRNDDRAYDREFAERAHGGSSWSNKFERARGMWGGDDPVPDSVPARVYAPSEHGYGPGMQYGDVGQPPIRRQSLRNRLAQNRADKAGDALRNVMAREGGSAWRGSLSRAKESWTPENTDPRVYKGAKGGGVEATLANLQGALSDAQLKREARQQGSR
jgi:hypothetical protein